MRDYLKLLRNLTMLAQLGFTLITPPVLLLLLAWWIQTRFSLGVWITVLALLIGLATSATSAYKFYLRTLRDIKRDKTDKDDDQGATFMFFHHE